jgi:uncharacterized protein
LAHARVVPPVELLNAPRFKSQPVGVRGQITFVAMRDIPPGSELTIDDAMIDGEPSEGMECSCGTRECRKVITGEDWRLPDLQRKYAGYFSRYLEDRFPVEGDG